MTAQIEIDALIALDLIRVQLLIVRWSETCSYYANSAIDRACAQPTNTLVVDASMTLLLGFCMALRCLTSCRCYCRHRRCSC